MQVGIEQSFESYNERQNIVLDEDDYDPSYRSFPTSSKPQLGKPITPFDDEIQYNSTSGNFNFHLDLDNE